MAVRKEENGKWTIDVYIETHDGIKKRYKKRGFPTKREAQDYEHKVKNSTTEVHGEKFSYYFEQYLSNSQTSTQIKDRKKATLMKYAPNIYNAKISSLTKIKLLQWRSALESISLSTERKNRIISYLKAGYKFASDVHDIKNISFVLQNFKKTSKENMQEFEVWTIDEFNHFIKHSPNPMYQAYFNLLFYTGMRKGESLALLKKDINTNDSTISINKSIRNFKDGIQPTKTRHSNRIIKVDTETLSLITPLLKRKGKWLFGDSEPIGRSTIDRVFNQMITDSGVKKIRLHDLRHSHATILINNDVNIVAVSRRLGHSDINMTLKVYTHLLRESENNLISCLEKIKKSGTNLAPKK